MELATIPPSTTAEAVTLDQLTEQAIAQITMPVEISEAIIAPSVRERHQAQITALQEHYKDLSIAGVDDKEGYDAVQKAITHVKGIATGIDKTRKAVTAPWDTAKKQVDAYANEIEGQVREKVLKPLELEKQRILDERARIEREEKEAAERKIAERKKAVHVLGMVWNGIQYMHQLPGVDPIGMPDVDDLTDEAFERVLETAADQIATARKAQDEAEAKAQEEKRIADEREQKQQEQARENERKAKELEEKEAEIHGQLRQSRVDALKVRGMEECIQEGLYPGLKLGTINVRIDLLHTRTSGEFESMLRDVEDERTRLQQEEAKAHREKTLRELRTIELQNAGLVLDEAGEELGIDGGTPVKVADLHMWSDEDFASIVHVAKGDRASYDQHVKEQQEELERTQALGRERAAKLREVAFDGPYVASDGASNVLTLRAGDAGIIRGIREDELGTMQQGRFDDLVQAGTEELARRDRAALAAKEEAEARRTDFERMDAYIKALQAVEVPKFKSAMAKHCAELLRDHISYAWLGVQKDLK